MTPARRGNEVPLLVAAHVALFIWALVWNWSIEGSPTPADLAVLLGVSLSQLGLLAVWAGLGRGSWILRLAAVGVLASAVISIPIIFGSRISGWTSVFELLVTDLLAILVIMVPIVLCLGVVRRRRWKLVLLSPGLPPSGKDLRFSLRHLLALTALAAGVLSAGYYARPLGRFEQHALVSPAGVSPWSFLVVPAVLVLSFMAAPLLAVWACLGVGRPGLRLFVAGFFCLGLGSLPGYCFGGDVADYALLAGGTLLQLAIIAGSLLVFREVGYRLVRHPTKGEAEEPVGDSD